jgi:butyryl-CoA dehydrogenase
MFHMMNEARIGVGTTAAATAWAAYRYSAGYALERMQGRRAADGAKARLVDHADVRRMLLTQKTIAEGGLSLCLFGACLVDRQRCATDDGTRRTTREMLEVLTPVIKAWCAERGVESNSLAIQVMGGAGYVRDHPVERLFRDQRLNPIHEGTNGILAIDLVVRKARRGAGLEPLLQAIDAEVAAALEDTAACATARCVAQHVAAASSTLRSVLATIAADKPPQAALAFATPIALMTGDLSVAWMWLKQTRAVAALDDLRAQAKRAAALHMVTHILPQSFGLAATVLSGAAAYDDLPPETFAEA